MERQGKSKTFLGPRTFETTFRNFDPEKWLISVFLVGNFKVFTGKSNGYFGPIPASTPATIPSSVTSPSDWGSLKPQFQGQNGAFKTDFGPDFRGIYRRINNLIWSDPGKRPGKGKENPPFWARLGGIA
jgi:hypothetical protein